MKNAPPDPLTGSEPTRILLIEDSPTQAVFTRSVLESAGYVVDVARDGRAGLAAVKTVRYELALSDVRMPLMDGFEFCRALKREFGAALGVILLTSVADADDVVSALEAGADNFVGKPFETSVLLQRVERTLQRVRAHGAGTAAMGPLALRDIHLQSSPEQMAEMLLSTVEDALSANARLRERDAELAKAHAELDAHAHTLEIRVANAMRALRAREAQVSLVVSNLPLAVLATDQSGLITFAEGSTLGALSVDTTQLVGRPLAEVVSSYPTALGAVERACAGTEAMSRIEIDGRVLELRICPSIQSGVLQGLACALLDVTEQERANAELDRLALADPLTGLPNRTLLRDRLRLALRAAVRGNGHVGVLFLDLDDFKLVNDAHGHQAGDKVLRDVGTRLASTLRGSDTLGRMGGDEFAIVLPTASLDAASAVATRVQAAMAAAFMVETVGLHIGVSIGIAVAPDSGTDADELLRCADVAMFVAKRSGSEQRIYSVDMDAPVVPA